MPWSPRFQLAALPFRLRPLRAIKTDTQILDLSSASTSSLRSILLLPRRTTSTITTNTRGTAAAAARLPRIPLESRNTNTHRRSLWSTSSLTRTNRPVISTFSTFSTFSTRTMSNSSDAAYLSFLDKANQDPSTGSATSSSSQQPRPQAQQDDDDGGFHASKTVDEDQRPRIPRGLRDVRAYYASDTDAPFEPVVLRWERAAEGSWPDEESFKSLVLPSTPASASASVTHQAPAAFDPQNHYAAVLTAVREAAGTRGDEEDAGTEDADVRVFRVQHPGARAEYWVLGLDRGGKRLVGMKARAVES